MYQFEFTRPLQDQTVVELKNAKFECELSVKNVPVTWSVGGVEVVAGLKYQVQMKDHLHHLDIKNVKPEDAGEVKAAYRDAATTCQLIVQRKSNSSL